METNTINKTEQEVKNKIKMIQTKNIIKGFTLVWFLVLIILMTITNIGINEEFNFLEWLSGSLIIFGIMVFGLLMGESVGTDKTKENENGLYKKSLREYNAIHKLIEPIIIYFYQFYQWLMPQELYNKKLNYLIANGVEINKAKSIIDNCSLENLFELKEHAIEIKGVYIRKLEEYEIEPVERVLKGEIRLNSSRPNYYLTALGNENTGSILEEGKEIAKLRRESRRNKRIVKIVTTLTISLVWGLLTVKEFMDGEDTQAWVNLVSRITALITSFASGWLSGIADVKYQSQALKNKMTVLTLFKNSYEKHLFKVLTEEQLAEKEFKEYQEKKEEQKLNVIEPEVITPQLENKSNQLEVKGYEE